MPGATLCDVRVSSGSLNPPRRLLMGSGPSNAEPRVLQAMIAAPIAPDDPAFAALLDDVMQLGRTLFRTKNRCTLFCPGASRAGIEAVVASLVEPEDRVLVGAFGHFGELLCTLATRHGARLERIDAEWGEPVDADRMAASIRRNPPKLVAIVHADTSTGILQPLDAIGAACRDTGALLLVDAVLSIGGCRVEVDGWSLDAVVGGLQKCLGGPPGLAPVTFSEGLREALARRRSRPRSAYLDLRSLAEAWVERRGLESTEMPTPMLLAAREALRMIVDEGLDARWQRHERASRALRAGLQAIGLELFGNRAYAAPMITLVRVPDGVVDAAVREHLLVQHGIEIMAAFGPLRGRVWRVGTMGTNACLPSVLAVLAALEAVLPSHGFPVPRGAAVDAALGAWPNAS
jgi:(S)-ureidoglycine---glyoxylate transaminase